MDSNKFDQNRRQFIKKCFFAGAAVLALPALRSKELILSAIADEKLVPLSEKDPMAVSLGYKDDAKKVDTKKFPKRAGPEGEKQLCDNCMFYTEVDKKKGKCQIFPGKTVAAKGWCNTWAKKAG